MKRWRLGDEPGHEYLTLSEAPTPSPGRGEVLVRMRAASINYRDTVVATTPKLHTPGRVPFSDGAGEVTAVGDGVTGRAVGDRVVGTFFRDWRSGRFDMRYHDAALGGSVDGVLAEEVVFPEHGLVRMPGGYSFEEAATLPCAGLTAWYALVERGSVTPGATVLLLGTGGVSTWGLGIANAAGCRAIITSSSDEKLARCRELGADVTINYRTREDWDTAVFDVTEGLGADHVLEVGGAGTLGKSLRAVAAGGQIALIGILTGQGPPDASLRPAFFKNARLDGIYVGPRDALERFVRFIEVNGLKPVVGETIPFASAPDAYARMTSGSHFGKIVVAID